MKRRPLFRLAALASFVALVLVLSGCGPTPVCVDEYIVNKTADTNDGVCSVSDCSLREAVLNANACPGWQTITVPGDGYPLSIAGSGEDAAATGDLDITDDVTIVGEGVPSIDGNALDRIFEVHSPAVVRMETMILVNGQAQMGGAVMNHGTLTLVGLSIHSNAAVVPPGGSGSSAGGGIFNETGTLTLLGTQVFGNSADHGGGIENFATATLEANDLVLVGNTAADGGGLWNNAAANATLENAEIRMNTATVSGAGIYNHGQLEINLATIEDNVGPDMGGGLINKIGGGFEGAAFLYDVWFDNNSADIGGAVYNQALLHLYRSSLTGNAALAGYAGGAYNDSTGALLLRNVTVSGNSATPVMGLTGAGIYNNGGEVRVEFVTVADNSPDGIVNAAGGLVDMRSTVLASHTLANCSGVSSAGYNLEDDTSCALTESSDLSGVSPLLAPLALNGGINPSHALNPGSPAIDSGTPDMCTAEDQRGIARPQGGGCDRGALEMTGVPAPPPPAPSPVVTPTEVPPGGTLNRNAFCRLGPSTRYFAEETYDQGHQVPIEGRSAPGAPLWWWTGHCWLSEIVVDVEGPTDRLGVSQAPPLPSAPTDLVILRRVCVPGQSYTILLRWVDAATNETGYKLYRNGELLASLGPNVTTYTDPPPFGGPYTYEVEAFNQYGVSERAAVQDAGCQ